MFYGDAKKSLDSLLACVNEQLGSSSGSSSSSSTLALGGIDGSASSSSVSLSSSSSSSAAADAAPLRPPAKWIGVPRELFAGERRVPMTPAHVRRLNAMGFGLIIETNAGRAAGFRCVRRPAVCCVVDYVKNACAWAF
jgi:hypothetical protein